MKKLLCVLLAAALLCSAASCRKIETGENSGGDPTVNFGGALPGQTSGNGADDADWEAWLDAEPFDYANNDLTAFVTIGNTVGLPATKASEILTDEEFENEIDVLLDSYSYYAEITEGVVSEGDRLRVDYAGYKDGEAFSGGTGYDQEVVAASGTGYIAGFAEAYIGRTVGEEFSFEATFPESYGVDDLNGQTVTFVTTVHAIVTDDLIVPEMNDEFVTSNFAYLNVEEFRTAYRESVARQKAYYVNSQMYADLWQQVLANVQVKAYPEAAVNQIYAEQRSYYEAYASYYGTDYESFLANYMATTDEELRASAEDYVKEDLVMYELAKELGVSPTEEEYDEGIAFYAEYNGMTVDDMLDYYGEDTLRTSVLWQALMERIAQDAVITEE